MDLLIGSVGLTTSFDSRGSLSPSAFTAVTRNTYSLSSRSLDAVNDVVSLSTLPALAHCVLRLSRCSMTYPVKGEPPSLVGGCHDKVTESFVMFEISTGPSG